MPEGDPLEILISHDRWATLGLLDACVPLTADQFHRQFDIGPGSLHDTLTHIIGAMRTWTDTLAIREPRPRLESDGQRRTPQELRAVFEEARAEFVAESRRADLSDRVTRRMRDGRVFQLTRSAVVTQVITHGMHHRAQCLNMLRQLGIQPLPPSSVVEWTWRESKL